MTNQLVSTQQNLARSEDPDQMSQPNPNPE